MRKFLFFGILIAGSFLFSTAHGVTYGDNFLLGSTATCSGGSGDPESICSRIRDGDTGTYYQFSGTTDNYFRFDLGASSTTQPYKVRVYGYQNSLKNFSIDGSSDGTNYDTLYLATTTAANEGTNDWDEFTFTPSSTDARRYIRLWLDDSYLGATPTYFEVEMMTDVSVATSTASSTASTTDFTSVCYTSTTGGTTEEKCYNPIMAQLFYIIDFLFFMVMMSIFVWLIRKIFKV